MPILIEKTVWDDSTPNHVYFVNNNKDKMHGYFNTVKQELFWFNKPLGFDRRNRQFDTVNFEFYKEDNMTTFAFTAVMNAIANLPKNTNFNKILKDDYGIEKEYSKEQAKFICQYLLQGSAKGFEGKELVDYALKSQRDLFDRFPHLKDGIVEENVVIETPVKKTKTATKTKAVKQTKKAAKLNPHQLAEDIVSNTRVVSTRKITANKPVQKYENGTVFFREDRQKWVAVWNNKQEAARPTKEGCVNFLLKKYNAAAIIVE